MHLSFLGEVVAILRIIKILRPNGSAERLLPYTYPLLQPHQEGQEFLALRSKRDKVPRA